MMKQKTIAEVDLMRLDDSKVREFVRRDKTKARQAQFEIIEVDKPEVVVNKEKVPVRGKGCTLWKIGYVIQAQSPQERSEMAKAVVLGDAKRWIMDEVEDKPEQPEPPKDNVIEYPTDEINPEDIPF